MYTIIDDCDWLKRGQSLLIGTSGSKIFAAWEGREGKKQETRTTINY